jgi:hypothetical protein
VTGILPYVRREEQGWDLTEAIRARKLTWAKLWTEELFPLWVSANHNRLPDDDEFRVMSEGHPVDAQLRDHSGGVTRFQITTAFPDWDTPGKDAPLTVTFATWNGQASTKVPSFSAAVGSARTRTVSSTRSLASARQTQTVAHGKRA